MVNGISQADLVDIDLPELHEYFTDPRTDEWCDSDEDYPQCVKKPIPSASSSASLDSKNRNSRTHHTSATASGTAKVTTEPLQRDAVDIYDKVPTASNANPSPDLRLEKHRTQGSETMSLEQPMCSAASNAMTEIPGLPNTGGVFHITTGDTPAATVSLSGSPARLKNKRTKRQKEIKKTTPPSEQKTSSTRCAIMDKLNKIQQALAVPMTRQGAPDSKKNAKLQGPGGKAYTNKKRKVKQPPSRKQKGIVQSVQVVPDILQPALSPTSRELSSTSSKPSKSQSSGTATNAAGSATIEESGSENPSNPLSTVKYKNYSTRNPPTLQWGQEDLRRGMTAVTPASQATESASANVDEEIESYIAKLSTSQAVTEEDRVLAELFDKDA